MVFAAFFQLYAGSAFNFITNDNTKNVGNIIFIKTNHPQVDNIFKYLYKFIFCSKFGPRKCQQVFKN